MSAAIDIGDAAARVSQERRIPEGAEGFASVDAVVELVVVAVDGEIDGEAWDELAERLHVAASDGVPEVVLDLSRCPHARPIPARAAGYVRALKQRGAVVVVRCSAYVRACIQASRYGAEFDVRWEGA